MSTTDKIGTRIRRFGPGWAFTAKDFLDLGSRGLVDVVLSKLAEDGTIRRLSRGLYDFPEENSFLGVVMSPKIDQVAQAIARRFRWHILPEGATAANVLGLSTQVPAQTVYLSDGPTRRIKLGPQEVLFKHARPKETKTQDPKCAMVVQALRYIGKDSFEQWMLEHLRSTLTEQDRKRLRRDTRYTSDWIFEAVTNLTVETNEQDRYSKCE